MQRIERSDKENFERRIFKELADLQNNPQPMLSAAPIKDSDLYNWQAVITGPQGTGYEGGLFHLNIRFPEEYPFKPPPAFYKSASLTTTKIHHKSLPSKYKFARRDPRRHPQGTVEPGVHDRGRVDFYNGPDVCTQHIQAHRLPCWTAHQDQQEKI